MKNESVIVESYNMYTFKKDKKKLISHVPQRSLKSSFPRKRFELYTWNNVN